MMKHKLNLISCAKTENNGPICSEQVTTVGMRPKKLIVTAITCDTCK